MRFRPKVVNYLNGRIVKLRATEFDEVLNSFFGIFNRCIRTEILSFWSRSASNKSLSVSTVEYYRAASVVAFLLRRCVGKLSPCTAITAENRINRHFSAAIGTVFVPRFFIIHFSTSISGKTYLI